jgi:formylglycine-generating enzyme required for sulfatase activity
MNGLAMCGILAGLWGWSAGAGADSAPETAVTNKGELAAPAAATPAISEPEMVTIPAGCFDMGSPESEDGRFDNERQHHVCVEAFKIGKFEVTQKQWREVMGSDPSFFKGCNHCPVEQVSWNEVQEYIAKLNAQTGKHYRLPTEAEWEYAARAGTETVYWWGNEKQPGFANCIGCDSRWGSKQPVPVGSFKPNSFGLYDTAGNVLEWVQDCWHDNYQGAPSDGSAWEKEHNGDCDGRVRRGVSYIGDARSSSRGLFRAGARFRALGFRLVREIE